LIFVWLEEERMRTYNAGAAWDCGKSKAKEGWKEK